jgi:(S)-2-hydroxyglutarate dehydrogenase
LTFPPPSCEIAVVGGGILGLATARELKRRDERRSLVVLEREARLAAHQTSHNSGVIHAGIYYRAGSLKARLCVAGARDLYSYCDERGVPYERRGKLIVASTPEELPRLDELYERASANDVPGLRRLSAGELRELEPHCVGLAALHSPSTGVVDFAAVAEALAAELRASDVPVVTDCEVTGVYRRPGELEVQHAQGATGARFVIFCAGAWSDVLAEQAGAPEDPRIIPFVGRYLYLRPERAGLVRSLIYPVPDPSLPFLGVHLTRHIDGRVSVGPTALLKPRLRSLTWPGTWRMARRSWRAGVLELRHALSSRTLASAATRYVPELTPDDFDGGFAGVRAQALARDGSLVDDFVISQTERALHVRNAPSPAATSSLAIARMIADSAEKALD